MWAAENGEVMGKRVKVDKDTSSSYEMDKSLQGRSNVQPDYHG